LPNEILQCSADQGIGIPVLAKQHYELIRMRNLMTNKNPPTYKIEGLEVK
jgi:hypothetical protein